MLCGILFVLHTGIQWEFLPQELGFGSGMTCWRRLEDWNEAGVWERLHELLLAELQAAGQAGLVPGGDRLLPRPGRSDAAQKRSEPGRPRPPGLASTTSSPTAHGIPLAVSLTGGNRNDVTQLLPLLDKIPPVRGRRGRPRRRPDALFADRGYDHDKYRRLVRAQASARASPAAAPPTAPAWASTAGSSSAPSPGYHGFRRLRIRWERRDDIHEAFLGLATCIITYRHVKRLC